ncbi:YtoQ family protein [Shewanella sp. D64]|uniref:YtoQ family protein n=1 Tax=unclassified Shewanella TaxID=196818 RepID=UPI0022BA3E7B|nr:MULTISPECIES: YtoQ family protein [unclassified Shewanella]MEC4725214.1 YtoQ family protein [Shewanella sp. D64]MEC4735940.1 YtoQ family protein [Shewanella sp. E94]WBJ93094.1 YtoQ family protein [Shewanella sp. MTB7]
MSLNVYLSGEIHTDWREQIIQACQKLELDIIFSSAVTNHDQSDSAGDMLRQTNTDESQGYWRDHRSAKVNAIRTKTLIAACDIAIIRFGDKYKQWNAAFDAGYCAALNKPYITLHSEDIIHPLKEVDSAAHAWATTVEQVVETLQYISQK